MENTTMDTLQAVSQATDFTASAASSSARKADVLAYGGGDGDFERVLAGAERRREEMRREISDLEDARRETRDREASAERAAKSAAERAEGRREALEAETEKEARLAAEEAREAWEAEAGAAAEAPRTFRETRERGKAFAYARLEAETTLPGGFRSKVSGELLVSGDLGKGREGVLAGGSSPAGLLMGALKASGGNLGLASLSPEGASALQNVLLASGMDAEQAAELTAGLFGSGKGADMNAVLRALSGAENASLTAQGSFGGLTATPDGLNSLGQFLLGLGLSPEAVRSVTTGIQPGSILPAATLRSLITGGISSESLAPTLGEGDLSYLALALQSMGAGEEAAEGISLMLEMKGGAVSIGDLLTFLDTLEKPSAAGAGLKVSPEAAARDIQTVLASLKSDAELVKAPAFNEIILKLSLLGDRQLDRNFYDLSPALQALRGGLGQAAGGERSRPFEGGGDGGRDERRGREERRLMASAAAAQAASGSPGAASSAQAGAFAAGLPDEQGRLAGRQTAAAELRDKLIYSARRGIRRLRMSLTPESLGGLDIELKVKGSQVTANVKADTLEAYKALETEVRALREELAAEGLELKLTLTYGGGGEGSGSGSFWAGDGRRYGLGGETGGDGRDSAEGLSAGDADGGAGGAAEISAASLAGASGEGGSWAGTLIRAVV
ncbi:MAG: flagellar hook-length control protein FliK [Deltaproteobacteria bacterium]|jgi:hypothetical protein|nr:flagellar hook-length control protein FliK [Deltaproteobacteria bacterium]